MAIVNTTRVPYPLGKIGSPGPKRKLSVLDKVLAPKLGGAPASPRLPSARRMTR